MKRKQKRDHLKDTPKKTKAELNFEDIPMCPVYRPSESDFLKPIEYIRSIEGEASKFGICKIIPPKSWEKTNPDVILSNKKKFLTKLQYIHKLKDGHGHDDGEKYTPLKYKQMADRFAESFSNPQSSSLEAQYWALVEGSAPCSVEYGSDLASGSFGSGFAVGCDSDWNLNRLPSAAGSLLRLLPGRVSGVNEPWLYFGMLFSTFCWHYEDDSLFSISYNHAGSAKLWYGVPGAQGEQLEAVFRAAQPRLFAKEPDLLMKLATMISPLRLMERSIDVHKSVHQPGEFMVTFPGAFHCGFNQGFNAAEAVNFALESWLPAGLRCAEKYAAFARESVLSHERMVVRTAQERAFPKGGASPVVEALRILLRREEPLRRRLKRLPLGSSSGRNRPKRAGREREEEVLCSRCRRSCFLSFVGCRRHKRRFGCLAHADEFCGCGGEKGTLFLQLPYSLEELNALVDGICSTFNLC